MSGGAEVTVICSEAAPISSLTLMVKFCCVCSVMPARSKALNPWSVTLTVYPPGNKPGTV